MHPFKCIEYANYNKGFALTSLKKFEEAIEAYNMAISLNSHKINAYIN